MAESTRTIFTGARLVDAGDALSGVSVVVEGSRFVSVEEGGPPPARDGDRHIDLAGRTLLPGMVSAHFHSGFGAFGAGIAAPMLGLEASPGYARCGEFSRVVSEKDTGFLLEVF